MSDDIIRTQLENSDILDDYNFILIRGNQPTGIKKTSMYCVVYSMYSILLFVLNYTVLNKQIDENKQESLKLFNNVLSSKKFQAKRKSTRKSNHK